MIDGLVASGALRRNVDVINVMPADAAVYIVNWRAMTISSGAPALARVDAEIAGAARHDQADVAVADPVPAARLDDDVADVGVGVGNLEPDRLGRIEQAIDVAFELEDAAVVGADALEHAVAVEQAVVEDADRRFGGGPERPAHVNEAVARVKAWRDLGGRTRVTLGLV